MFDVIILPDTQTPVKNTNSLQALDHVKVLYVIFTLELFTEAKMFSQYQSHVQLYVQLYIF